MSHLFEAPLTLFTLQSVSDIAPARPRRSRRRFVVPPELEPLPPLSPPPQASPSRPRLDNIDLLHGLIMVIMVLDHVRDFFGASGMNPRDVDDAPLFLTR